MSEQKKFNIGDRVRVKDPEWELRFDCGNDIGVITSEDIGKVKGESFYGEDFVEVAFCDGWVCDDFTEDELELVESYDPKTAFLLELKGLLEKYGAKMSADVIGPDLDCAEVDMLFVIGDDEIRFDVTEFNYFITPDNIAETACYEKK